MRILAIMVNTKLIIRQVAKGKKNLKFPLLMNISPGSFPKKGIWCQKVKSKPKRIRKIPPRIRSLPSPSSSIAGYLLLFTLSKSAGLSLSWQRVYSSAMVFDSIARFLTLF